MQQPAHYTFGDSELASERLRLLAQAFAPSSRDFLATLTLPEAPVVVDLGCGPGHSTAMLGAALAPGTLYGLDRSERLLSLAREHVPAAHFAAHDVTRAPFPAPPADLLYARFLVTHLPDPAGVLATWASAARAAGLLALEETAAIACDHPAFVRYYALVAELQAHYGQTLEIGRELERLAGEAWSVVDAHRRPVALPAATMARLHAMNIETWAKDPFAQARFDPAELAQVAAALDAIARGEASAPNAICTLQQLVLRAC